jgi:hypothetical protein
MTLIMRESFARTLPFGGVTHRDSIGDDWHNATRVQEGCFVTFGGDGRFTVQLTDEEIAAGFVVADSPTGRALMIRLSNGLRAVKTMTDDGAVEYVICNDQFEPLYAAAKSLDELRRRF